MNVYHLGMCFRTFVLTIVLFLAAQMAFSQAIKSTDLRRYSSQIEGAMLEDLDQLPADSSRVKFLLDFGYVLETICPDTAVLIYVEAADLANDLGRNIEKGKAHMYMGIVASDQGDFARSFEHYEDARIIFEDANALLDLANLHVNMGVVYNFQSRWNEAAEHYFEAIEYYDSLGSTYHITIACGNVGGVLMDANQPEKALPYFERGYEASLSTGDSTTISSALINIGFAQQVLGDFNSACNSYQGAIDIAESIHDTEDLYLAHHNMSDVLAKMNKLERALDYARKAYEFASGIDRLYYFGNGAMNLGSRLIEVGQLEEAEEYLVEALEIGAQMESNELMSDCHELLAMVAKNQGDFESAYNHMQKFSALNQLTLNQENVDQLQQLEVEYQSVQKDKALLANQLELEQLDSKVRRGKLIRNGAIGAGILLAIILGLFVRNFMQKRKLHRQEIDFIRNEQKINSIQSYLDGEEKERLRIAKDLHDGLSGLLAATKLQFSSVQGRMNETEQAAMTTAMSSLDNASVEVRRIAHNMMPEMLISYGLVEALKSFFAGINSSGQLEVEFQYYGMEDRLQENVELSVYRIIQELINNVIKHAEAGEAIVQINRHDGMLAITVEDDGKGFDVGVARKKGGIGLSNLESRVDVLGSTLSIESSPGKGTFTYFEVDLEKLKIDA